MKKKNELLQSVKIIILGLVFSLGIVSVFGQINIEETRKLPPSNNVSGPLNEGPSSQIKDGGLSVNAFIARGDSFFMQKVGIDTLKGGGDNKPLCVNPSGTLVICSVVIPPVVGIPTVTTSAVTGITETSASGGGNVTSTGGATVTVSGIVWSTSANPTIALSTKTTDGWAIGGPWTSGITGLSANTIYHVRAYATNSVGTGYGSDITFATLAGHIVVVGIPIVTTSAVTGITQTSAVGGGDVTSDGGATVTARGIAWSASVLSSPDIYDIHTTNGTGTGSFSSNITGLSAGITYFVRAYATNSVGTAYGSVVYFTTAAAPVITIPSITTISTASVTQNSATGRGNITSDGGATVTARGIVWSTAVIDSTVLPSNQTHYTINGTGIGSFSGNITGLSSNTYYHLRPYATNSAGTAYGGDSGFITLVGGSCLASAYCDGIQGCRGKLQTLCESTSGCSWYPQQTSVGCSALLDITSCNSYADYIACIWVP